MKPPTSLQVLIADDHGLFRAGLIHLIEELAEHVSVLEANSLDEAIGRIDPLATPDLMLVDLMMPGMGEGASGIRRLREIAPDTPLVVLSAKNQATDVRQAIEAGALGFIPKSSSPDIMLHGLRLVLSGGIYLPAEVMGSPALDATSAAEPGTMTGSRPLTARQRQILTLLSEGRTNKDVARRLGVSIGTVKIHVSHILRALGVEIAPRQRLRPCPGSGAIRRMPAEDEPV